MSRSPRTTRVAVVAGDVTIDWNLARTRHDRNASGGRVWNALDSTRAYRQRGGAALLADVIAEVAHVVTQSGQPEWEIRQNGAPTATGSDDAALFHSYALWTWFPPSKSTARGSDGAWRVAEYLGLDRSSQGRDPGDGGRNKIPNDAPDAELVVLDDANLDFRHRPADWPAAIASSGSKARIVLKMSQPVAQGRLWERLLTAHADRVVVVMSADDLRLSPVQVSRRLSWERTAEELAYELTFNPHIAQLSECAHAVVSFGTAGAYVFTRNPPSDPVRTREDGAHIARFPRHRLILDPAVVEGAWGRDYPGGMIGSTTCLTAAVVRHIMLEHEHPLGELDLAPALRSGLGAMRALHVVGYGSRDTGGAPSDDRHDATSAGLRFPADRVVAEMATPPDAPDLVTADIDEPREPLDGRDCPRRPWSILERKCQGAEEATAERIVRYGAAPELKLYPIGRFGDLLTTDRTEAESLRSIQSLIAEYRAQNRPQPLSIAVFGAPGAGKSFAVKQLAKNALGDVVDVTFNLSQLHDPEELIGAFHQVRDEALKGAIPLVFWDEFDSTLNGAQLAWLRYFLAPMQDGRFQQGEITHPIGHAVFVFAGGKYHSLEDLQSQGTDKGVWKEEFRDAKVPDFISRLKGHVTLSGPDPREGEFDPCFPIRRAVLLRSLLERLAPALLSERGGRRELSVDPGVLRAFLTVSSYRHGVRSMESIISMSSLAGKANFDRSSLPSEAQLDLHVDAREFMDHVERPVLVGELLERLARAAHELYRETAGTAAASLGFDELPPDEQEQNRGLVRDIPIKLASQGYVMAPGRERTSFTFGPDVLEELAEREHERWCRMKLRAGWAYAPTTNKPEGRHQALLPWRQFSDDELTKRYGSQALRQMGRDILPEKEKDKDRTFIEGIPRILAKAGYVVARG